MSADNKLKKFSFKLLYRILVTKKGTFLDECFFCKRPDSLENTFLASSVASDFYHEMTRWSRWFNNEQKT